jgi:hypothetical protein
MLEITRQDQLNSRFLTRLENAAVRNDTWAGLARQVEKEKFRFKDNVHDLVA